MGVGNLTFWGGGRDAFVFRVGVRGQGEISTALLPFHRGS
jgi:hypothetical protein